MRISLCLSAMAALVLAACGGSNQDAPPSETPTPAAGGAGPTITVATDGLEVGPAPFAFTLSENGDDPITGARLDLRFFFIDPRANFRKTYKAQVKPTEIAFDEAHTLTRPDGSQVTYEPGASGVYVANIAFDSAGDWVVDVTGDAGGHKVELTDVPFVVAADLTMPEPGEPAPQSANPVLRDVSDISEIDSSAVPDPALHEVTIAEATQSGRPSVIVFASEGLCLTDICGPMKELSDRLAREHDGRANFIHVEPYGPTPLVQDDPRPLPWVRDEWGLAQAPAVFFLDSGGFVRARYVTIASYDDLARSLDLVAGP